MVQQTSPHTCFRDAEEGGDTNVDEEDEEGTAFPPAGLLLLLLLLLLVLLEIRERSLVLNDDEDCDDNGEGVLKWLAWRSLAA